MVGIYKITSPTGRTYIGQSVDIERRRLYYKGSSDKKKQPKLHASFLKYSYDSHSFDIVEECLVDQLNERERYWQDHYNVMSTNGLNCKLTKTDEKSGQFSEYTKRRISIATRGKPKSARSEEHSRKISEATKGKVRSKEQREKVSKAHKGKVMSQEARKKMSESHKGKTMSDIAREKMSEAAKKRWNKVV